MGKLEALIDRARTLGRIEVVLLLSILLSCILGASLHYEWLLMLMILLICVVVGLVSFGKLNSRYYPYLLGVIGLSMLLQTTLYSPYLIGTDIHTEYYYYSLAYDGWNPSVAHNYNSALGLTVLAPLLSKLFHVEGTWIFRIFFPLVFSCSPPILYLAFRRLLSEKEAFLSSFFFISVPVFFLEVIGITKLQLCGLFLALSVLMLVTNFKGWKKLVAGILIGFCIAASYYTIGFLFMLYLVIGLVVLAVIKIAPFLKTKCTLPLEGLMVTTSLILVFSLLFFGSTSGGEPLKTLAYYGYANILNINPNVAEPLSSSPQELKEQSVFKTHHDEPGQNTKESLMKAGLGLDLAEASWWGRVFRLLQLITEGLIISGGIYILLNWKKFPDGYLTFLTVSVLILSLTVLKPGFANLLNMTRMYHLTLYIISPLLVLGARFIKRSWVLPVLGCGILIPYFLFTSGFIFEAVGKKNIEVLDLPYSIALSSYRIDISGVTQEGDEEAIKWLLNNLEEDTPIYADLHGMLYLYEFTELATHSFNFPQGWIPYDLEEIPRDSYIFLRQWSIENEKVTYWTNIGLRKSYTFEEVHLEDLLEGRKLLYDGKAKIYGMKEDILESSSN